MALADEAGGFAPDMQAVMIIIDEATASVRFIVPIASTKHQQEDTFTDSRSAVPQTQVAESAAEEVALIRRLFFGIFVEVVISSIQGEAEI